VLREPREPGLREQLARPATRLELAGDDAQQRAPLAPTIATLSPRAISRPAPANTSRVS
jgi:hypothetical protein